MADVFDVSGLSLSTEETRALNECIFEGVYKNPQLNEFHKFVEGITADKKITILGQLTGLAGQVQAGCTPGANETAGAATVKTWTPKYISDRWTQCYADLMDTFWRYALKPGTDKPDLSSTEFASYLQTQLQPYVYEILLRIAYFGDTAIASGTNNKLTAGQIPFFNMLNGYWKQIATGVAGSTIPNIAIAKNAGVSYVAQAFDATDRTNKVVTTAFENAYLAANTRLTDQDRSNMVYLVTKSMADQYWLERTEASGIDLAYQRTETGMDKLQFNGIDVVPINFWDRIIRAYFHDDLTPVKWINPHRGILTTKDNLLIGTQTISSMQELDAFHDKKAKDFNVDWGTSMDVKLALDYLTVAIY